MKKNLIIILSIGILCAAVLLILKFNSGITVVHPNYPLAVTFPSKFWICARSDSKQISATHGSSEYYPKEACSVLNKGEKHKVNPNKKLIRTMDLNLRDKDAKSKLLGYKNSSPIKTKQINGVDVEYVELLNIYERKKSKRTIYSTHLRLAAPYKDKYIFVTALHESDDKEPNFNFVWRALETQFTQ